MLLRRAAGLGVLGAVALAAPAGAQTVTLSPPRAPLGTAVTVGLAGWPSGPVQVELCGDNAARGSADCDVVGAVAVVADAAGAATASLVLAQPSRSCPCVVRVSSGTDVVRLAPIGVDGVATGLTSMPASSTQVSSPFRIERVRVTGSTGVPGWFGAAPARTAEVTVENTGSSAGVPPLELSWSKGVGTPRVIGVDALASLDPGESRTYRIEFHLPTMAVGSYVVTGSIAGVEVTASTSTTPWALVAIGALVVYVLLTKLVVTAAVRVRARRRPAEVIEPDAALVPGVLGPTTAATAPPPGPGIRPLGLPGAASGAVPLAWPALEPAPEAVVARWDLAGAATPELVLAALLDAGASEAGVREQLASLPVDGLRFDVARDDEGTSVIVEVRDADALRRLGSVGQLLAAGTFTAGTLALARRALGFLADASPTPGIPAEPATILATIGACAAVDDLGIGEAVSSPVELADDAVGVEVLRRHRIPWVATLGATGSPAAAALAVVAATMSPTDAVGPAVTTSVGHGHPSPDRASEPGAVRVVVGTATTTATGTDPSRPARSSDHPSASAPRPG